MRFQQFLFVLLIFIMCLLLINGQRPANLAMRRKLHRQNCLQRRCMPLHSRVPFP
ncbi:apelin receptor early endogenous ligand [Manis javanica]|uniref:apelin receptor early endogenous ligand n=1 Tax=Manis javanica TaxID=9974 RepID=UPI0008134E7C|nr:apelin receptor early endogenous ligand [Manis javanica]